MLTILLTSLGTLPTAAYPLHMFLITQRGKLPTHLTTNSPTHPREHLAPLLTSQQPLGQALHNGVWIRGV